MDIKETYKNLLKKYFGDKDEVMFKALEQKRFFVLPASSKYHLSVEGGLALHSLNVYEIAMKLRPIMASHIPEQEVALVTLFHDLNKLYAGYTINENNDGSQHKTIPYKRNSFIADFDSLSCYLVRDLLDLKLSPRMYNAICNHNIFNENYYPVMLNVSLKHPRDHALTLLLQTADMYCAHILEAEL